MKDRRSKRVFHLMSKRQLLIVVGVFSIFSFAIFQPDQVSARGNLLGSSDMKLDSIEDNKVKIQKLEEARIVQQQELDKKLETIKTVETEAKKLETVKTDLHSEVETRKAEVAALRALVEEKKNRTVPQGRNAPDSAGNAYAPGNCTWYVKQKRPDIGNFWGNANMWYSSAQAAGFKTGKLAKTGAIGVSFEGWAGHVVYVEKWLGNGRLLISEMNVGGLYVTATREVNESEFVYIYEL
jgi:surface antigen